MASQEEILKAKRRMILLARRRRLLLEGSEEPGGDPNAFVLSTETLSQSAGYDTSIPIGSISPGTWNGETLASVAAVTLGSDHIKVGFVGNVQIAGITTIEVTFEGAADNPYTLTWDSYWMEYRRLGVVCTTLNAYLDSITGTDIAVTITDVT